MKKRIVYILSTNFAGSHYLSLLLGSNSRALHAGELFHFGRPVGKRNLKEVNLKDSEVFEGIGPHNIEQVYDIIFSRIDARIEVVVDTSKTIRGWAERFLGNESYDRLYIHLIRDPRALVCRWLLNRELKTELRYRWKLLRSWPRLRPFVEWSPMPAVWMYRWLLQNRAITDFIGRHGLPATLVTYRDLAKETEAQVRRLTEWMGLTYEPRQLEYWSGEHIGSEKRAYEWVKKQKTHHFDLRWKTELAPEWQARICCDRLVNDYLRELGLAFTDEGLTRLSGSDPYRGQPPRA